MKIRYYIALVVSKIIYLLLSIFGEKISSVSGSIALKICPDFLKYISKPALNIGVIKDNGAELAIDILCYFFKINGCNTVISRKGCYNSLVMSLISYSNKKDVSVVLVDDMKKYKFIDFDYIICNNDINLQLDSQIIQNADRSNLLDTNQCIYYSINNEKNDIYSNIYRGNIIKNTLEVKNKNRRICYKLLSEDIDKIYFELSAIVLLSELNNSYKDIGKVIEEIQTNSRKKRTK